MSQQLVRSVHWAFFVAIEHDLETVFRYVEPVQANFGVHSLEISRVLFAACAECEIVLKEIVRLSGVDPVPLKFPGLRTHFRSHHPHFAAEVARIPRYELGSDPWENWRDNPQSPFPTFAGIAREQWDGCRASGTPVWWTAYNKVKHQRVTHYQAGNLSNAIDAVAALFTAVTYLHKAVNFPLEPTFRNTLRTLSPRAELFRNVDQFPYLD